ncbi:MAG: hypothetical protein WCF17_08945, partial [Terracidiphilus sp.]
MHIPPLLALSAWIPIGLFLFRRFQLRVAILANFLTGWAVLPSANYATAHVYFPYWILPVCLPSDHFVTKATILGFTAICGALLFCRAGMPKYRVSLWDIPIVLWCIVPLCSCAVNRLSVWIGLTSALYLFLSWLVPYYLGRLFFCDSDSLLLAAKAIVFAGIVYLPICLLELFTGPQLYSHIYGYQPFRWIGAARYLGFRPIGFLEDGNQLGIWMATSALVAAVLSIRKLGYRILGLPLKWVAPLLISATLLCQSAGSILLLALLGPVTAFGRRSPLRIATTVLLFGVLLFTGLQFARVVPWREIAQTNPFAHSIASGLRSIGRKSLGWRLGRDEGQAGTALRKPFFGSGEWNWWRNGGIRPWDLWMLVFGMYGALGVFALGWILISPIIRIVWFAPARSESQYLSLTMVFAGLLMMSVLDILMNAAMILPYL